MKNSVNRISFLTFALTLIIFCLPGQTQSLFAQTNEELVTRAKAEIEKREYDAAISDLTAVITSQPKNDEAYAQRARAYFLKTGNDDAAFADAEKALNLNSKNIDALNIRGKIKVDRKQTDSALDDFNKAIKIDPNFTKAYLNRAVLFTDKNEFDKAIDDYTLVLQIESKNPVALQGRGLLYVNKRKDYAAALVDFKKLAEIAPTSANSFLYRGRAYQFLNNSELALADFNRSIELNPKFYLPYLYRGILYYGKADYNAALRDYLKALELETKNFDVNYNLALVYRVQNKYDAAIAELNKIPSNEPVYPLAKTQIDEIGQLIANDKLAVSLNIVSEPFKALFDLFSDTSHESKDISGNNPYTRPDKEYDFTGHADIVQPADKIMSVQLDLHFIGYEKEEGGYRLFDNDSLNRLDGIIEYSNQNGKTLMKVNTPQNHHYGLDIAYKKKWHTADYQLHFLDPKYLHYNNNWDLINKILFFFGNASGKNAFVDDIKDENDIPLKKNPNFISYDIDTRYNQGNLKMRLLKFADNETAFKALDAVFSGVIKHLDLTKYEITDHRHYGADHRFIIDTKNLLLNSPQVWIQIETLNGEVWMTMLSEG